MLKLALSGSACVPITNEKQSLCRMCNRAAMTLSSEKDLSFSGSWLLLLFGGLLLSQQTKNERESWHLSLGNWCNWEKNRHIFQTSFSSFSWEWACTQLEGCVSLKACLVPCPAILFGLTLFLCTELVFCGRSGKPVPSNISYCYAV